MEKYTVEYDDGKVRRTFEFDAPERLPQPGDVYEFMTSIWTLANKYYKAGDRMTVIERTTDVPHFRKSSLGNLRVKCMYFTSVWTNFDSCIAEGILKLVEEGSANAKT